MPWTALKRAPAVLSETSLQWMSTRAFREYHEANSASTSSSQKAKKTTHRNESCFPAADTTGATQPGSIMRYSPLGDSLYSTHRPASSLLQLPGEIRNRIYVSALERGDEPPHAGLCHREGYDHNYFKGRSVYTRAASIWMKSSRRRLIPKPSALAATSRQFRHEVLSFLYGNQRGITVEYRMCEHGLLAPWLDIVGPYALYLRRIEFVLYLGRNDAMRVVAWLEQDGIYHCKPQNRYLCRCTLDEFARAATYEYHGKRHQNPLRAFLKA